MGSGSSEWGYLVGLGQWFNSHDETWYERDCPNCSSKDIRQDKPQQWHCEDCNFEWQE